MSDRNDPPADGAAADGVPADRDPAERSALDAIRREAKQLLRQARAGDAPVLAALKALLPRLATLDDAAARDAIKLADVQHAIARKLGHEHWAALKAAYERMDPLHVHAARFLQEVNEEHTAKALALLEQHPGIARYDLRCACAVGELATAQALLAADPASLNRATPPDRAAPLIYAAVTDIKRARGVSEADHVALVRMLLDAGASPNTSVPLPDVSDAIPVLYFPCVAGNVAVARLLLERGAEPTDGEALYHAAQHDRREVLELLREFGADLSHGPTKYGNTPLHFLAAHRASNPQSAAAMRGMQWLLEHGADPNVPLARVMDGMTPSQLGETPLHRVAASGYGADIIQSLLTHGARVDATRDDGVTPYMLAVRTGNVAAADALAAAGADVTRPSLTDRLLGACLRADASEAQAIVGAHPGLMASLDDDGARAIFITLDDEKPDALALMLSLGWPLAIQSEWGGTPLHWAAWQGRVPLVKQLLAMGAPVNVRDTRYGSSPIAWTAHGSRYSPRANDDDYPAIVHLLIDAGATRAEAFNRWNEAPERLARPSVVQAMRERGFAP